MGNPKQKWTAEEEQALREGVHKYGAGKWKFIHSDPVYGNVLHSRSNIDLKDKWRNLRAASLGNGTRSRTPKPKLTEDAPIASVPSTNVAAPAVIPVAPPKPATNFVKEEHAKETPDTKNVSRSSSDTVGMIFEALSASTDQNGLDIGSIVSYIEQRITDELPQNFRKQLGARLRRLVLHERLEKVENCYRLKKNSLAETNAVNRKDVTRLPLIPAHVRISESLQEAAKTAAYKVAEAEEKTYLAALSVKEAERFLKMQEESDAVLQLAQQIFDRLHNNEALLIT